MVNGYRFHTKAHSATRATDCSGICVLGKTFGNEEEDYYGVLDEIIELNYVSPTLKRAIIFNCTWFDMTHRGGSRIHPQIKVVDVNKHRKMLTKDRYIFSHQATQVYFLEYPNVRRVHSDWMAVCKVRSRVWSDEENDENNNRRIVIHEAFQQDVGTARIIDDPNDVDILPPRHDPTGTIIVEEEGEDESSSETTTPEEEFDSDEDTQDSEDGV